VAHLDAAEQLQGPLAPGARIAAAHQEEVVVLRQLHVPADAGADEVGVGLVGAADEALDPIEGAVGQEAHLLGQAHRAGEAHRRAGQAADRLLAGELEPVGTQDVLELRFVDLPVAPDEHRHRSQVALVEEGLDDLVRLDAQERGDLGHGVLRRGGDFPELARLQRRRHRQGAAYGLLHVGGVAGRRVAHHGVLAGVGQDHELVGVRAADLAGLGLDHRVLQMAGLEDPPVGALHGVVGVVQALGVGVEGVGVLHDELAAAHEAEAGPDLVAELLTDLVEGDGELAVRGHVLAHHVGDHLLGRGSEAEVPLVAVLHTQEQVAVFLPAPGLLPQLGGLDRRHGELHGVGGVELAPHDGLELADAPPPEGQVGVDPGRHLFEHAGADHELVAHHLGVVGNLAGGEEVVAAPAHGMAPGNVMGPGRRPLVGSGRIGSGRAGADGVGPGRRLCQIRSAHAGQEAGGVLHELHHLRAQGLGAAGQ
jgi:hypothetical protein